MVNSEYAAAIVTARREAIFRGLLYIVLEIAVVVIVWSRFCLAKAVFRKHTELCGLFEVWKIPPFYILLAGLSLVVIIYYFFRFMLSFRDSRGFAIRPGSLVACFTVTSLLSVAFLFAALHRWTGIYGDTALICKQGQCIMSSQIVHDLQDCFYFSVITLTTVGYGDFHPMGSLLSHTFAETEALSGYIILGVLVSSISDMVRSGNRVKSTSVDYSENPPAVDLINTASDPQSSDVITAPGRQLDA